MKTVQEIIQITELAIEMVQEDVRFLASINRMDRTRESKVLNLTDIQKSHIKDYCVMSYYHKETNKPLNAFIYDEVLEYLYN